LFSRLAVGALANLQHEKTDVSACGGFFMELAPKKKNTEQWSEIYFVEWNSSTQNAQTPF
jgi:hypothetical protein